MKKKLDERIDELYREYKSLCEGKREDYFGLLYLMDECDLDPEHAIDQVAFGGNDYGVDGFFLDKRTGNFYIYQFKYSAEPIFKSSLERLIDKGVEIIFSNPGLDKAKNPLLDIMWSRLHEFKKAISTIYFRFIFLGDSEVVERSLVLEKLREDLDNKRHFVDSYFKDQHVDFIVDFRSYGGKGGPPPESIPNEFTIGLEDYASYQGPSGESMHIGLVRLDDLRKIYSVIQERLFERNIRFSLNPSKSVNRVLMNAFRSIILEKKDKPEVFAFNHNGITLYADRLEKTEEGIKVFSPRILNGAQTITTYADFFEKSTDDPRMKTGKDRAKNIRTICKIVTDASEPFVITTTINNNRQNPVAASNLRANDMIQVELQDKFREERGIFYERQEGGFKANPIDPDIITSSKPVELIKLARTYIVSDGEIQLLSNLGRVFEEDKIYSRVFAEERTKADLRQVVLCYKIQFNLKKYAKDIVDLGASKYGFVTKARNLLWALLCQALLNDKDLDFLTQEFGSNMNIPAAFKDKISSLATSRCKPLLKELIEMPENKAKAEQEKFDFLRSSESYKFCIKQAANRWGWNKKRLVKPL